MEREDGRIHLQVDWGANRDTGVLEMRELLKDADGVVQSLSISRVNLRDQAVRDALIQMGWRPPEPAKPDGQAAGLYVIQSDGGQWKWGGLHLGEARVIKIAMRRSDPGVKMLRIEFRPDSVTEVPD